MTLRAAIEKLQAHAHTAGANEYPTDPVEANVVFPFSVVYLSSGIIMAESGGAERDLATVYLDLHVNRVNLPTDVVAVLSFYEAFKPLLIADPTLGGTAVIQMDEANPIKVEFGGMKYAEIETVGLRYSITLKKRS